MRIRLRLAGQEHEVTLEDKGDGYGATVDGTEVAVRVGSADGAGVRVRGEGVHHEAVVRGGRLFLDGEATSFRILGLEGVAGASASGSHSGDVRPPMTGRLVSVRVEAGQEVFAGDVLFVLEAMKMQNDVRSPVSGRVTEVLAVPGTNVEPGQVIVRIEPA